MKPPRKSIPVRLRNKLFDEVRSLCPNPDCKTPQAVSVLEIHHRDGNPTNNVESNLIALCSTCHTLAEKQLISETDLDLWKRMVVAKHHPRLGPMKDIMPMPEPAKILKFEAVTKSGTIQQAEVINNHTYRGKKSPPRQPAPDSIGAHAAERSYIRYLREQYMWCRTEGQKRGDKAPWNPASVHNIMKKALGGIYYPYDAPITEFPIVVEKLTALVLRTKFSRQIGYHPHSWEKHQQGIMD